MAYVEGQQRDALLLPFTVTLTKDLYDIINLFVKKAKRKLTHNTKNDVGTVEVLVQDYPSRNSFFALFVHENHSSLSHRVANVGPI